jgi:Rrf2 family iron-sulfur cluster assembly transcriptional regulator
MKLTAKSRYAVTALLDLALHGKDERVTLMAIADRQVISLSYLEQLFSRLRKAGLVRGIRGPGGGYVLAKNIDDITIAAIIEGVDEPLSVRECDGEENCFQGNPCLAHDLWTDLDHEIFRYLNGMTLGDILAQKESVKTRQTTESVITFTKSVKS